jgi:2-C-methyl-D-erythritol 2,4-cyclodiphosphate synthase
MKISSDIFPGEAGMCGTGVLERILRKNGSVIRVGLGYDIHPLVEGRKLVLGGVDIPFEKGLDGHSDADVLVHAVCDALLGAVGAGDIGLLFPDTDARYRGIDSRILLARCAEAVAEAGYRVGNVDAVVRARAPRLSPHRSEMEANLAETMEIDPAVVNLKATTTEGMGAEGDGSAISAYAVVLVYRITPKEVCL